MSYLKKVLTHYKIRKDREFFDIDNDQIKEIYESFNYINKILNTEEKLIEYMKINHPEYFKSSRKILYSETSLSESFNSYTKKCRKKKKILFVDTSY